MESIKGKLLLAGVKLLDPNFAKTVTLMIDHDEEGALGLVLNRAMELSVAEAWKEVSNGVCVYEGMLYRGGPVPGPVTALHDDPTRAVGKVLEGVYFTNDGEHILDLVAHPPDMVRFFVGYAGWSAGQLESEIDEDSWILSPAKARQIYGCGEGSWFELLRVVQPLQARFIEQPILRPRDPSVN